LPNGIEVETLLVSLLWLLNSRTFVFALDRITTGCKYPENWLIQDVLAECLIHFARSEIAYIPAETALNTVEGISNFFVGVRCGHRSGHEA